MRTIIANLLSKLRRIPLSQKLFFVQHLGVMLKSGISLSASLKTLSQEISNKKFKNIITNISQEIEKGGSFYESLARYPHIFGELFINMIKAGEVSGELEKILNRLYLQMKNDHDLLSKVKGAMIYPVIILSAMIGIGTLMIVYIIPKITSIFKEVAIELPLATRILIKISDMIVNHGLGVGIATIAFIIFLIYLITYKPTQFYWHWLLLKSPIIGGIIKKINLARFARTLSSLLKTDIPIVETFEITANVLGNQLYTKTLKEAKNKIKGGTRIEESLKPFPHLFPPLVLQMIKVGEDTGSLDSVLEELATFFEDDINQIMKNLPSIIEPLIMLVLGLAVAGMAVAVIMPMYSLTQQF